MNEAKHRFRPAFHSVSATFVCVQCSRDAEHPVHFREEQSAKRIDVVVPSQDVDTLALRERMAHDVGVVFMTLERLQARVTELEAENEKLREENTLLEQQAFQNRGRRR